MHRLSLLVRDAIGGQFPSVRGTQPLRADKGGHELRNMVAFKNWERPFVYNQWEMKTELYNAKRLSFSNCTLLTPLS